ncbi:MAG: hypothetical protein ABI776_00965 [Nocardioidaceae bacterium]
MTLVACASRSWTESFLPQVNGVSNTVRHTVDRLVDTGHERRSRHPDGGPGWSWGASGAWRAGSSCDGC